MIGIAEKKTPSGSPAEVFSTFLKLGLTSFGGPIAHLGYFRIEIVERRRWLSDEQFGQLLAICQFLPGPASSQLGFTLGLLRAGWLGALAAFVAFTLPSALMLLAFAAALPLLSGAIGEAAVHGLKLVACAVVADAVLGMSKKLCPDALRRTIAVLSAAALLVASSAVAQLTVVIVAAVIGAYFIREIAAAENDSGFQIYYGPRIGAALLVIFGGLLLGLPLIATGRPDFASVAEAFYRAGALVFGGGHVVLPLLQDSVVATAWVTAEQFLSGYGASQAIPGPMFAFSAYLGAVLSPLENTYLMAATALVFMFLPGFLLVAGVLPFWGAVSRYPTAGRAIAGVNAAVVGLLAAALYDPIFISGVSSPTDLAVAVVAFALLAVWRVSPLIVVLWCVIASVSQLWLFP
ncbi:chromate efflux transporter [Parahaliea sp. F7430]|uniref:Chromate efflux transporter n=1 Tax=Sediminihaliea albiluteola TaxID=2758564 RepID=A0A7W2YKI3_9GAMM|nr:chromate efflux transporter [Sediminihaliea albiluteola]MBA6413388.1 chromate efflux transporter [Sediminihaliea albiluteola]